MSCWSLRRGRARLALTAFVVVCTARLDFNKSEELSVCAIDTRHFALRPDFHTGRTRRITCTRMHRPASASCDQHAHVDAIFISHIIIGWLGSGRDGLVAYFLLNMLTRSTEQKYTFYILSGSTSALGMDNQSSTLIIDIRL